MAATINITFAQVDTNILAGLELVAPENVPYHGGSFWSLTQPNSPPAPTFILRDLGVEAPVYSLGSLGWFIIDDRDVDYGSLTGPLTSSGDGGLRSPPDFGCGLYLDISGISNNASSILLTLHNTRPSQTYTIWSITNLALTNWVVETNVAGAGGDLTETLIAKGGRPALFFKASESRDYSVDTNSTFAGLGYRDTLVDPPDTMGAVGLNHVVELLNFNGKDSGASAGVAVYTKLGQLVARTNAFDFFRYDTNHPNGNFTADGRILFDQQSQRWVACAIDGLGSGDVILAVSNSDAPTNLVTGWTKYLLQVHRESLLTDFTTLGIDGNGIYVRTLHFGGSPGTNGGHTIVAIKKPEIYAGTFIATTLTVTSSPPVWTIQPVVNFDLVSTNDYAWFVAKGPPDLSSNYQGGALWYHRLQWSGTNATWAETNWLTLAEPPVTYRDYYDLDGTNYDLVPSYGAAIFAPQLGQTNAVPLHDVGSRFSGTVIRNGELWTCQAVGLHSNNGGYSGDKLGTSVDRSGVQWLRLGVDPGLGTLSYGAHARVYDTAPNNPYWYHFPSVAVNCTGDMITGFSGSSLSNYVGAFYACKIGNGPASNNARLVRAGRAFYSTDQGQRWGDYSATVADPGNIWSFWTMQEYSDQAGADDDGNRAWKTVLSRLRAVP